MIAYQCPFCKYIISEMEYENMLYWFCCPKCKDVDMESFKKIELKFEES